MTLDHHEKPKHVTPPDQTGLVIKLLRRLVDLATIELLIGIIHCLLTAAAVFGLLGATGHVG